MRRGIIAALLLVAMCGSARAQLVTPSQPPSTVSGTAGVTGGSSGQVLGNSGGQSEWDTVTGDVTLSRTGANAYDSNVAGIRLTVANEAGTGTTVNTLTKLTGAPSTAIIVTAGDTGGSVGITVAGAGKAGNATVRVSGSASCVFDGATTAGDYIQISATIAGNCHDSGATYPTSGQVIGRVLSTNGGGGTYAVDLFDEIQGANPVTSSTDLQVHSLGAGVAASGTAGEISLLGGNSNIRSTGHSLQFFLDTTTAGPYFFSLFGANNVPTFDNTNWYIKIQHTTVGALPTCNASQIYDAAVVTDADACTFQTTVVHTNGTTFCPAICNGTNWVAF